MHATVIFCASDRQGTGPVAAMGRMTRLNTVLCRELMDYFYMK